MTVTLLEELHAIQQEAICLYTYQQVEKAIDKVAKKIKAELAESNPVLLSVMMGALPFTASLMTRLQFPLELDYIHVTRYEGMVGKDKLASKMLPTTSLENRVVLIVDDILDRGITLNAVIDICKQQNAKAVYTAVLLDKKVERLVDGLAKADFCGLEIENHFVFGFGLDYKNYLRNAPGIFAVKEV